MPIFQQMESPVLQTIEWHSKIALEMPDVNDPTVECLQLDVSAFFALATYLIDMSTISRLSKSAYLRPRPSYLATLQTSSLPEGFCK